MADIFLSYASEDRERVRPLVERLEEHGWSVWWDRRIPPGKTWPQVLEGALESCRAMVVVWTEKSVKSKWVRIETAEGVEMEGLVPVRLDVVKVPLQFRELQAADLTDWDRSISHPECRATFSALEEILGVPRPAAEPVDEQEEAPAEYSVDPPGTDAVEPTPTRLGGQPEPNRPTWVVAASVVGLAVAAVIAFQSWPSPVPDPQIGDPTPPPEADDPLNQPIWIEGGTFPMGSDAGEIDERPVHRVTVSGFWIQEHEVTNEEFRRFDAGHEFTSGEERYPVVNVNWQQAMDYAAFRGGTLPTEAQWEFVARGTAGRTYPWGEAAPVCEHANFDCDVLFIGVRPIQVMSRPDGVTPEGVHDLAGNVYEWVADWFGPYIASDTTDPTGPASGFGRVLRGGSYASDPPYLRATFRSDAAPDDRSRVRGFRVAFWAGGQD